MTTTKTDLRGYRWTMNYRGFDIFQNKSGWIKAIPTANLIEKDLATEDHYHMSNDFGMIITMVDDHFEVLEAMESE